MTIIPELNPCPACGSVAEMRVSFGGFDVYYGIYCTDENCGCSNRVHNSTIFSHGLGYGGGFPPTERDVAIRDWNMGVNINRGVYGTKTNND